MKRSRQGMTLIETMVAAGLAFLLAMVVYLVMTPSFRLVQEGQIRTELQQQGELALQQLCADLQNSVPTGISIAFPVGTDGMMVATQPIQQVLGTGVLSFDPQLWIWYHNSGRKQLFRKRYTNPDPSAVVITFQPGVALQTTQPTLKQICATVNNTERSYAMSVESFTVQKEEASGGDGGEMYAARILLQKDIPGKNRKSVVELFRKVMLRNHY